MINIINAAQESSPVTVAEALERVLEILRTTELYSPQLASKEDDPHTNDLVGGLMNVRRSTDRWFMTQVLWRTNTVKNENGNQFFLRLHQVTLRVAAESCLLSDSLNKMIWEVHLSKNGAPLFSCYVCRSVWDRLCLQECTFSLFL